MEIKDIDFKNIGIDDNYLLGWISKDLVTSKHFCYLKIDRRNLTENFEGNEEQMLASYCQSVRMYAGRYAYLTFGEELTKQLKIKLADVSFVKEIYEDAEDTTWLLYEFIFMFLKENEKGEKFCVSNAAAVNSIKCDYAPRILAEKVKDKIPELKDMKTGEVRAFGKDMLEKVVNAVKDEEEQKKDA